MTEVSQRTDTELADNQSDSPASSAADSDPLYEPSLVSEEAHSQILGKACSLRHCSEPLASSCHSANEVI